MKIIKKKIIYCSAILAAGIILFICSVYMKNSDSMLTGMWVGLSVVALLKLIQFIRLSRKPEKLEKYELMQNEERLVFIVTRSGYMTFLITIFAEYVVLLLLTITGRHQFALILCGIVCLQMLCYLVLYYINNRKY